MIAAILAAAAVAATPPPMTLAQAVAFADAHNQSVLAARSQWVEAGATLAHDRSTQLPLVQANAQSTLDRQSTSAAGSFAQFGLKPQPNFSQNTAQVEGQQSVFNFENELVADQARHSYDQAAQNYRLVREQTLVNVETSFYTYVQDVDLVSLNDSDLKYEQALLDIANANYRSGLAAGIDRLKAQVQVLTSQETLSSSQADAEDARENLAELIGAGIQQDFTVPPAIVVPAQTSADVAALDAIALVHRPEIAMARDTLDNAVLGYGLVDAPNTPTVALSGAVGDQTVPTDIALDLEPPPFGCAAPYCGSTHFYTIALNSQILLPLIDWGTLHSAHVGARSTIEAQTAAFEAARQQALVDVDQAARRLIVDYQNLTLASQSADEARQAAKVSEVQYRVGLASQLDVTSAEQTYLQAAKQLLTAQVDCMLEVDKLKLATGTLITE
jgi:outer membrane protein